MTTLIKSLLSDHKSKYGSTPILRGVHPLGRVPNVGLESRRKGNKRINRYLQYQEKRLVKHLLECNYRAIVIITLILLKNSLSYQIVLFHRVKSQ